MDSFKRTVPLVAVKIGSRSHKVAHEVSGAAVSCKEKLYEDPCQGHVLWEEVRTCEGWEAIYVIICELLGSFICPLRVFLYN